MTQEHVPRAEQNNHAIQERVQAAYYRFLLTHLPRILWNISLWNHRRSWVLFKQTWCVRVFQSARDITPRKLGPQTSLQVSDWRISASSRRAIEQ